MTVFNKFLYLLRKHASLRFALFALFLIIASTISLVVNFSSKKVPKLTQISPSIALPGDTLHVYGANFGNSIEDSYIEIAGNRLTSSSYISWTDSDYKLDYHKM